MKPNAKKKKTYLVVVLGEKDFSPNYHKTETEKAKPLMVVFGNMEFFSNTGIQFMELKFWNSIPNVVFGKHKNFKSIITNLITCLVTKEFQYLEFNFYLYKNA